MCDPLTTGDFRFHALTQVFRISELNLIFPYAYIGQIIAVSRMVISEKT